MERDALFTLDVMPDAFGHHPWARVVAGHEGATYLAPVGTPAGSVVLSWSAAADAAACDYVLYLVPGAGQVPGDLETDYLGAAMPAGLEVMQVWIVAATEDALRDVAPRA